MSDPGRPGAVRCAILTVSDVDDADTDRCGSYIRARLERAGHDVAFYDVLPEKVTKVGRVLDALTQQVDVILISGGTALSQGPHVYEVIAQRLEKPLPGFGEILRNLYFEEHGASAFYQRAIAGIYSGTVVFVVPNMIEAVKLAVRRLVLPELKQLAEAC